MLKKILCYGAIVSTLLAALIAWWWHPFVWVFVFLAPTSLLAAYDLIQKQHTILRNYPVIGHARYMLEDVRHQIRQYLIQGDNEGVPFTHAQRALVYRRAKNVSDILPFGTILDVYEQGFEWINHSMYPHEALKEEPRVRIGNSNCKHPYEASRLNISAMSFGALSGRAITALNQGAKQGKFAHNTGEGGLSDYHRQGGDLIWEIGTGYFGCRDKKGNFEPDMFADCAAIDEVKMIELKLSQGAKPGGGGILPAEKITPEIARARSVEMGFDVISPRAHTAFDSPEGLMEFIAKLRELSGGKPVGFKMCMGRPDEFLTLCRAMCDTNILPDYIVIDGKEGGTGAAPAEFSNGLGTPLTEGLIFAHNALVGAGLREHIKIAVSGKIISGFDMVKRIAIGADFCYSARGMMFSLGCIQARRCHTNRCPSGVATQDPWRENGLVVSDKAPRVFNYHNGTIKHFLEMLAAIGVEHPDKLVPGHLYRRSDPGIVRSYHELFNWLQPGALLNGEAPPEWQRAWAAEDEPAAIAPLISSKVF